MNKNIQILLFILVIGMLLIKKEDFVSLDQVNNSYKATQTLVKDLQNKFNAMFDDKGSEIHAKKKIKALKGIDASDNKLCSGGVCVSSGQMKQLLAHRQLGGFAINGDGSTHPLIEGYHPNMHESSTTNIITWGSDRWDDLLIFKGWKVEVWENPHKGGHREEFINKTKAMQRFRIVKQNKTSSFNVTWVGY